MILPVKLGDLVAAVPAGFWVNPPSVPAELSIKGLTCDSRTVGDGFLFVALPGEKTDGAYFGQAAIAAGAGAILVSGEATVDDFDGCVLRAHSPRQVMGLLASLFYRQPSRSLRLIGITGTDGKTSTVWILHQLLLTAGRRAAMTGTLGVRADEAELTSWEGESATPEVVSPPRRHWRPTTPESPVFQATLARLRDHGIEDVVVEVSSHGLAQCRIFGSQFAAVALTHIASDHLDFHGSEAAYRAAKASLFNRDHRGGPLEVLPVVEVLNLDDSLGRELAAAKRACAGLIGFGRTDAADVRLLSARHHPEGMTVELSLKGEIVTATTALVGRFNEENLLAACALASGLGLSGEVIATGLSRLKPAPGRFEAISEGQSFQVIVDYAHTADGLSNLLEAATAITTGRILLVFGCGGDRDEGKRQAMGHVAGKTADHVIVTSDNPRSESPEAIANQIIGGLEGGDAGWELILDRREALAKAIRLARPGDLVVAAGKGAEAEQVFADRVEPFDDRQVLGELLCAPSSTITDNGAEDDPWSLAAIAAMCNAEVAGVTPEDWQIVSSVPVPGIVLDSRQLGGGEVFIALEGTRADGHEFVGPALAGGASAALVSNTWWNRIGAGGAPHQEGVHFVVDDPLLAMQTWARRLRERINPKVVGITGSSGKTTAKEMILGLMGESDQIIGTLGNRNNHIGLPWTMLRMMNDTHTLVLEMGTNHLGEIEMLSTVAQPDVALITCIGSAHEGQLGGPEGVLKAKLEILAGLNRAGTLVIPDDDPVLAAAAAEKWQGKVLRFGFSEEADVQGLDIEYAVDSTHLRVQGFTAPLRLQLLGRGAALSALAAIAVLRAMEWPHSDVSRLEQVRPTPGRLYPKRFGEVLWLLDMYNASPESTRIGLEYLAGAAVSGRKIFVFGGMRELDQFSSSRHLEIGTLCGFCDLVVLVGERASGAAETAREAGAAQVELCDKSEAATEILKGYLAPGDAVLLKGARSAALEKVAEASGVIDASFGKGGF
jgi:MurE/MurF fusion protein